MPEPVDYAALAEQARQSHVAPIDYAALAQQARGSGSAITSAPTSPALAAKTGLEAYPLAVDAAERFATSPTMKVAASTIARNVAPTATVLSGIASGAALGGVPGAIVGGIGAIPAATRVGWPMGKVAYRATRAIQNAATPIAKGLAFVEPAARAIASSLPMAAQGGLDLAQTLEPKRTDIGILGFGRTPSAADEQAMIVQAIKKTVDQGTPMKDPFIQGLLAKLPQATADAITKGQPLRDATTGRWTTIYSSTPKASQP